MDKMLNWISIMTATVGGFLMQIFGGLDGMMITLIVFVILDYITGVLKSIYNKKLSSEVGFKGIIKKIFIFIVVIACNTLQTTAGVSIPLREAVIVFYVCNEGLSLVENIGEIIPLPKKIKDVLLQLRDKTSITKESEEK